MRNAKIRFLLALLYLSTAGIKAQTDSSSPTPMPRQVDGAQFSALVAWILDQPDQKNLKTLDASFLKNLGLGDKPLTFKRSVYILKDKRVRTFNVCPETGDIFLSEGKNVGDPNSLVIAWIVDKSGHIIRTIERPNPNTYTVVENAVYQELLSEVEWYWVGIEEGRPTPELSVPKFP
jgi:hypothetical protein